MKLSIITINYNNRDGLRKTIDSVLSQTWHDFEWIVIDGGSTDGGLELLEQNQEHFAFWCHEKDNGVFNAMNKGIAKAKGEYLNFMNSGDTYHDSTTLENVFRLIDGNPSDIYYGDYYETFSNGTFRRRFMPDALDVHFLMHMPLNHQSSFIQRILLSEKNYDESYRIVADWKAFMQWLMDGVSFYHLNAIVADFDMGGINQSLEEKKGKELQRMIQETIPPAVMRVIEQCEDYEQFPTLLRALRLFKTNKIYFSIISRIVKCLYQWDGLFHKHQPLIHDTLHNYNQL